ncbi:MAG: serine hydrolase domain-containing protein, partial [Oscillospiraceae bacterium]
TGYNRSFLFDDNDTFAHDNLLNRLASENLKADPGAFSVYCNDGFTLAEILVEKVSGISFTEFLDKEFFTPLNLKNTKTPLSDFDHKNLAKTYSPFDGTATLRDTINVIGAGGVYSTAEEVCKFGDLLTGRYPELLSKESVEAMQQSEYLKGVWPDSEDSIIGYGLGWDSVNMYPFNQYGIKAYTKGGDTGLYHASIVSVPQYNISATVLESGGSSIFATIMASQMILERLLERGVIDEIKEQMTFTAPVKTPMPEGIESFSGAYAATGNGINVKISNDEVRVDTTPEQVFVHTKDGIFESPDGSTSISFVLEDNGLTYLHMKTYMTLPGVGQTIIDEYNAQKLEKNPITDEVKAIWNERNGKRYFTLNDKKTSELMLTMPSKVVKVDAENGYASACKIIDENTAVNFVQIPGMNGRDSFDLNFYEENNKKYLKDLDNIRICEDSVDPVWVGSGGVCTILDNGYLRWYTVPTEAVGMRMTVKMPSKAEIFVYDEKGMIVKPETVTDGCSIILPNNGMIVFAGDIGDVFGIDIEQ